MSGTWKAGPSSWKDGVIPKITLPLNIAANASPVDRVIQGYADVFHKIHQTSDFKRDNVVRSLLQMNLPSNPTPNQQTAFNMAQGNLADTALTLLINWANNFIDALNEYSKVAKKLPGGAGEGEGEVDSDNPLAAIAHITPEDFKAVSTFLQYADAYSLQDAAEAANFE